MKYIKRETSLLTGKKNLEHLYTFKNFPVFMGCTDQAERKDVKADMSFSICQDTGIIQLDKLLPLELVYQNQHNDGVGKVWQEHYKAFSYFLEKFSPKKVLEIGGANDFIAGNFLGRNSGVTWTVVEPHPLFEATDKIKIIKSWFDDSFKFDGDVDTITHSHVLEHTYDPPLFMQDVGKFLPIGGRQIFTFPNMVEQLSRKYTNCLNFEHTAFLAEPFVDYLLLVNGFKILDKEYFQDHSIFYATEKVGKKPKSKVVMPKKYNAYKKLFLDFVNYHEQLVCDLNTQIEKSKGKIFLFGAHIFSQYLLEFGLKPDRIKKVLDNSDIKNKKRLYGTKLIVEKPDIIRSLKSPAVIVKIAAYRDEVVSQLKEINPSVRILE